MGDGHFRRGAKHLMKRVYFAVEGDTDWIVLPGLISHWLGDEDFIPTRIKFPSSAYAEGLETNLSGGWKGVLAWCEGISMVSQAGRDEAIRQADCLIIHIDADVATDPNFKSPPLDNPCPPAKNACDWVRNHLTAMLGGSVSPKVVLCVPAQDLEAWVLCALHPDVADEYAPIECRQEPATLLVQRPPHRLVRRKDGGRLKKEPARYKSSLPKTIKGWPNCAAGEPPRCPEARRFEQAAKQALGVVSSLSKPFAPI